MRRVAERHASDDVRAVADCGHKLRFDAALVEPLNEEPADGRLSPGRLAVALDRDQVLREAHDLVAIDGDARHTL
jgi:hypothetical protein